MMLPLWVVVALLMGAFGPFVALGGHGTIAWVAIRRFFERVRRRIDEVAQKADFLTSALSGLRVDVERELSLHASGVNAQLAAVTAGVTAEIAAVKLDLTAAIEREEEAMRAALSETILGVTAGVREDLAREIASLKGSLLSARGVAARQLQAVEMDIAAAADPTARALLSALGRRRGGKALEFLQAARVLDTEAHPELHAPAPKP